MTPPTPWTAERTVDPTRARELVDRVAPALRGLPVQPLSTGWDNTVHRVGPAWTARFPRRAVALPGFRRELAVLPLVAGRLPLAVPEPGWTGTDDDPVDPWPFAVMTLVPGEELAEAALAEADRTAAGAALGAFLRVLHAPGTRAAVAAVDLPADPMSRGWPAARLPALRQLLDQLAAAGTWERDPAVGRLLDRAERLAAPRDEPVLVHGDLHVRHLLVAADGTATGVIDWGDVCLADPAVDLALAFAGFSGPARDALLDAYGTVGRDRGLRARVLAVRLSAMLADHAAATSRPALLGEALAGLRRAVE